LVISPAEIQAVVIGALVLFASGFLTKAGERFFDWLTDKIKHRR
jgi:hypothetical protein